MRLEPVRAVALLSLCLAAAPVVAQTPVARPDTSRVNTGRRAAARATATDLPFPAYSTQASRTLFAACDEDGDDQIKYREAMKALRGMTRDKFNRADTDGDGQLQFNEFDAYYRERYRYGGQLLLTAWAAKRLPRRALKAAAVNPLVLAWFTKLDHDANDRLSRIEWRVLGALLDHGKDGDFVRLDKDLSGYLEIGELQPVLPLLTQLEKQRKRAFPTRRSLPGAFRVADLNADSLLSLAELTRALGRIHPSLVLHAGRILRAADDDRDNYLDPFEIAEAQKRMRAAADSRKAGRKRRADGRRRRKLEKKRHR